MINKHHPYYEDLTDEQKEIITTLHNVRAVIEEASGVSINAAKKLYPLWIKNEQTLQALWGFKQEDRFIKHWYYSFCTCPKMDNDDAYPTGMYITSQNCPIHGMKDAK